jgi:hypothetical protein
MTKRRMKILRLLDANNPGPREHRSTTGFFPPTAKSPLFAAHTRLRQPRPGPNPVKMQVAVPPAKLQGKDQPDLLSFYAKLPANPINKLPNSALEYPHICRLGHPIKIDRSHVQLRQNITWILTTQLCDHFIKTRVLPV